MALYLDNISRTIGQDAITHPSNNVTGSIRIPQYYTSASIFHVKEQNSTRIAVPSTNDRFQTYTIHDKFSIYFSYSVDSPNGTNFTHEAAIHLSANNMLVSKTTVIPIKIDVYFRPGIKPVEWYVVVGLAFTVVTIMVSVVVVFRHKSRLIKKKSMMDNSSADDTYSHSINSHSMQTRSLHSSDKIISLSSS